MTAEELKTPVKETVLTLEPGAQVYLYGSRARGDAHKDSDWDFLVLLPGAPSWRVVQRVRHRLYDVELETGEIISTIVEGRDAWSKPPLSDTPLHNAIDREGVAV